MTPSARLAAAIEALGAIAADPGPPADRILDRYLRERRYIGSKDRHAIVERVFGVLRRRARLDWHLRECGYRDVLDARRRVLADVIVADGRSLEALAMLFAAGPHATGALSERELALAGRLAGRPLDAPGAPPECPYWLAERLRAVYGERFEEEMSALNRPAPFDLRVNLLKADSREAALAALKEEGVEAEPTRLSPLGLRLAARKPVEQWAAFRAGLVEVQDEGSQIVTLLVDARPGMKVADYCAGAGGKTLGIAAAMRNEGRIVACDTSLGRLERARVRLRRAGVHNVETHVLAPGDKWVKRQAGTFDRVLVDAPCSGSGTWRRNPDARWRYGPEEFDALVADQRRILDRAAGLVKPGGRLIYATCALLKEENEDQVAGFLDRHPGFRQIPVAQLWPAAVGGEPPTAEPSLRLSPARHGTDGFFVAVLERERVTEGAGLEYRIRPATPEDAGAAARVQLEGWRSAYAAIFPAETLQTVDLPVQVEKWRERLSADGGRFGFVASVGAEVIGVLAGGPPRDNEAGGDAEIYSLYVLSWWRGRRVGEALMTAAFAHLAATGRRRVGLWVLSANLRGRAFFHRLDGREGATRDRPSIGGLMRPSTRVAWDDAAAAARTWADRRSAVEIRHADLDDAAGIARVQIDTWRTAYKRIMPPRLLGEMNDVRIAAFWAQIVADSQGRSFCLVATVGERVVGFASCGLRQHSSDPHKGEVYALYVLPEFQGRGIGRRLVEAAFERMLELGMTEGRIWTLRDNAPARAFYAHIGGTRTDDGYNDIGGIRYPEVAFDWPDLRRWKESR